MLWAEKEVQSYTHLNKKYDIFKRTLTRPEDKRRMKSLEN